MEEVFQETDNIPKKEKNEKRILSKEELFEIKWWLYEQYHDEKNKEEKEKYWEKIKKVKEEIKNRFGELEL